MQWIRMAGFPFHVQGSDLGLNMVAVGGVKFSFDRIETRDDGVISNDLYFTWIPSLGLDVSADIHGTSFTRVDGGPISEGDVSGLFGHLVEDMALRLFKEHQPLHLNKDT